MITIINPRAQFPATRATPMARRLDSLAGKTVYIVDVRWPYTHQFAEELSHVFSERFPDTNFVVREKAGPYMEDDPKLWSEIQERGHAAIVAVGH